jgi:hypothetical protein
MDPLILIQLKNKLEKENCFLLRAKMISSAIALNKAFNAELGPGCCSDVLEEKTLSTSRIII